MIATYQKSSTVNPRFAVKNPIKEPLIKYIMPLLDLTGVNARRSSKAMAVVLGERFNKAVMHVRKSPSGHSSYSAFMPSGVLGVIFSRRDQSILRKNALIAKQLECQRDHRLDQRFLKNIISLFVAFTFCVITGIAAANPVLAPDYPDRYTVVEGDTLWDISRKFLRDPWRWPEVWQGNPQVENPDLIFPGDVLVMTFIDGRASLRSLRRETVKLSPTARPVDYIGAIPPIDPAAIQAYINSPLVTDEKELLIAGYVVDGYDNRLIMGKYDQLYARGIGDQETSEYRIFRPGRHFVDPISKESLGWEAEHVGDARLLRSGDPARLSILKTYTDVSIRDRLRPIYKKESLPLFFPKAPDNPKLRGVILETTNRTTELGALSVVALNLGEREGVQAGDVFRILSQSVEKKDPVNGEKYRIPEEKIGLLLVFRTFDKVSYALITNSSRGVRYNDVVVSPNAELP